MSSVHIIRLRGPWRYKSLSQAMLDIQGTQASKTAGPFDSGQITVPSDWNEPQFDHFQGLMRFSRRFNRPTGLVPSDRIYLAFEKEEAWVEVHLNERHIFEEDSKARKYRSDITDQLLDHNQLSITFEVPDDPLSCRLESCDPEGLPGGKIKNIRIEIENRQK